MHTEFDDYNSMVRDSDWFSALDKMIVFPTVAPLPQPTSRGVGIPIHTWFFNHRVTKKTHIALRMFAHMLRAHLTEEASYEAYVARARPFLGEPKGGCGAVVTVAGTKCSVAASNISGHLHQTVVLGKQLLPEPCIEQQTPLEVPIASNDVTDGVGTTEVHFLPAEGVSVISDIDDTIKASNVSNTRALLANTFFHSYKAFPNIAEVYRKWAAEGAAFHYVSSTPWQLYPELRNFLRNFGFPRGSVHLKHIWWKDISCISLFRSAEDSKRQAIKQLLTLFPKRTFILVGDTTERDPELYSQFMRTHGAQIAHVYLRLLDSSEQERRRIRGIFADLDSNRWSMFSADQELPTSLQSGNISSRNDEQTYDSLRATR